MTNYTYYLDEQHVLSVFENDKVLATVTDVKKKQADEVFKDVVFELRGIDLDLGPNK